MTDSIDSARQSALKGLAQLARRPLDPRRVRRARGRDPAGGDDRRTRRSTEAAAADAPAGRRPSWSFPSWPG